jgi:hypothetical protein
VRFSLLSLMDATMSPIAVLFCKHSDHHGCLLLIGVPDFNAVREEPCVAAVLQHPLCLRDAYREANVGNPTHHRIH